MATLSLPEAKRKIFEELEAPLSVKRSAWRLYIHELQKTENGRPVSPRRALSRVQDWVSLQVERQRIASFRLSPIQKRILYLMVVEGFTQGQAAIELDRSHETIKRYCINLRKQLGVVSFYQVIAIAVEMGWIPAPPPGR